MRSTIASRDNSTTPPSKSQGGLRPRTGIGVISVEVERYPTTILLVQVCMPMGRFVQTERGKAQGNVGGRSLVPVYIFYQSGDQYIPPMPPPMPACGAAASFSGWLTTSASVVSTVAATEAAFWSAERVTFFGSTIPFSIMST